MEQLTANEVRDAITWKYGDKSTRISAMLNAFADLLEAREKAKPVMIVNHVSSAEHDLPIGMKLYTHPSPSDAERLEETDRCPHGIRHPHPCRECEDNVPIHDALYRAALEASGRIHRWRTEGAQPAYREWMELEEKIDKALAIHSAQAQPAAPSKYAPPYPDQSDEWAVVPRVPTKAMIDACCKIKLDRLAALRDGHGASSGIVDAVQEEWAAMIAAAPRKRHDTINLLEDSTAQPPAASVPNGLIDALRHQRQIDECGDEVGVSRQAVDEAIAILTMFATQENPNG